jgi:hypothetical protein
MKLDDSLSATLIVKHTLDYKLFQMVNEGRQKIVIQWWQCFADDVPKLIDGPRRIFC